jgi:hypothetical protein
MTGDDYINGVLRKYWVDTSNGSPAVLAAQAIYPIIEEWAGTQLHEAKFSGSHAKGTGLAGVADTDVFISLKPDTTNTLKDIYHSLASTMRSKGYNPKLQNVSIRVHHNGVEVDLVPGVKHSGNSNYHWLYVRKSGRERTQTNIDLHIQTVLQSGRINEIRATKIWAYNHGLDFPSIHLELVVIKALSGYQQGNTANNFLTVLEYIRDHLETARFIDPANTANPVSDDLTDAEKQAIARQAGASRLEKNWEDTLW